MKSNTQFEKGHMPWNKGIKVSYANWRKGLTKETDKRVASQAQKMLGVNVAEKSGRWKTRTQLTCITCQQKFVAKIYSRPPETCSPSCSVKLRWIRGSNFGKKNMAEVAKTISAARQKIPIENWVGFSNTRIKAARQSVAYKKWRLAVFERDEYTCQDCKKKGCYLEAHHILSFKLYPDKRYDVDNGITYCRPCHIKNDPYIGKAVKEVI